MPSNKKPLKPPGNDKNSENESTKDPSPTSSQKSDKSKTSGKTKRSDDTIFDDVASVASDRSKVSKASKAESTRMPTKPKGKEPKKKDSLTSTSTKPFKRKDSLTSTSTKSPLRPQTENGSVRDESPVSSADRYTDHGAGSLSDSNSIEDPRDVDVWDPPMPNYGMPVQEFVPMSPPSVIVVTPQPAAASDTTTKEKKDPRPRAPAYYCCPWVFGWFNLMFWIIGLVLLNVGIIARVYTEPTRAQLNDRIDDLVTQIKSQAQVNVTGDILTKITEVRNWAFSLVDQLVEYITISLIVFGSCIFVTTTIGCMDACCRPRCQMTSYSILMLAIVISQVVIAAISLSAVDDFTAKLKNNFKNSLKMYDEESKDTHSKAWSATFHYLECCGFEDREEDFAMATWSKFRTEDQKKVANPIPIACCKDLDIDDIKDVFKLVDYYKQLPEKIKKNINKIGEKFKKVSLPANITQKEVINVIKTLEKDDLTQVNSKNDTEIKTFIQDKFPDKTFTDDQIKTVKDFLPENITEADLNTYKDLLDKLGDDFDFTSLADNYQQFVQPYRDNSVSYILFDTDEDIISCLVDQTEEYSHTTACLPKIEGYIEEPKAIAIGVIASVFAIELVLLLMSVYIFCSELVFSFVSEVQGVV